MARKVFVGPALRRLRDSQGLTQTAFAQRINLSVSYLNQLENNQRPVTASVLLALSQTFGVDLSSFAQDDTDRLVADMREVFADPLFREVMPSLQDIKRVVTDTPTLARAFLRLHQTAKRLGERLQSPGAALLPEGEAPDSALLPYEEVRDFFHYIDNYVDELDRPAEELSLRLGLADAGDRVQILSGYLSSRHGLSVDVTSSFSEDVLDRFHSPSKTIILNKQIDEPTRTFLLAARIARLEQADPIETVVANAGFRSAAARDICRIALANHYAGAMVMPYKSFLSHARSYRHDLNMLSRRFGVSVEQVGHRLASMQRPGMKGIPFYFLKVDRAGNVIKRHSATRFQFARFGGACPLWNVHESFEAAGKTLVQVAEMPDGIRYLCLSRAITKLPVNFQSPVRRYAVGMGCEISYASELVYADGLDLRSDAGVAKIGVTCRICERRDCLSRAAPPIDRNITVPQDRRSVVPFDLA